MFDPAENLHSLQCSHIHKRGVEKEATYKIKATLAMVNIHRHRNDKKKKEM